VKPLGKNWGHAHFEVAEVWKHDFRNKGGYLLRFDQSVN